MINKKIQNARIEFAYEKLFRMNTIKRKTKTGYCVKCKKGLWSVDGPGKRKAIEEARRYFAQYFADGEYDK